MTRILATGIGSMPGGDPLASEDDNGRAFSEAVRVVLGELPDLPHLPELPARSAGATMTGRGVAVLDGLAADLQPAGWRLTANSGIDQRRSRSLFGRDLDTFEELLEGWEGPLKVQMVGPWTLAATTDLPRGDKVLSDHGARRDLTDALAEGLSAHVADVRRRVRGATDLLVQIDEPALPAVLGGGVPTASGYGRHRSVHPPEASDGLRRVFDAVRRAGGEPVVHCCAPDVPIELVRGAGAAGVAVDLDGLDAAAFDRVAEAIEAGERIFLGAIGTQDPAVTTAAVVERVSRLFDMLGLEPNDRMVIAPACGLAGADATRVRAVLGAAREAAAAF